MNIENLWPMINGIPKKGFELHYLTLYSVIVGLEAETVLEFGAGYSTHVCLHALKDSHRKKTRLITIDRRSPEKTYKHFGELPEHKTSHSYLEGDFDTFHDEIKKYAYDVCLHDGSHDVQSVKKEIKVIVPLMKLNGIILIHDTWWSGGSPRQELQDWILSPDMLKSLSGDLEFVTLPYGAGLTIARVKKNFGHGSIETTWFKGGYKPR